jgi:Transposase DDE domain
MGRWCTEAGGWATGEVGRRPADRRADPLPFKHHSAHRHRIPRARYRVQNWPAYEAGLKRRGDLTLWLDEAAIAKWQAPRRTTPGGQRRYSNLAIELVLMLRLVFHLALRQAEGFVGSVLRLLGLDLGVPDHTTLSRRSGGLAGQRPRVVSHGPLHLVVDSTGLQLFGRGEWQEEKHGRAPRSWRKLHIALDAETGEIVAHALTDKDADDAGQLPVVLEQVEGAIASVTADGAYDGEPSYEAVAARQADPPPDIVIPPRVTAAPSKTAFSNPRRRDRHIRLIREKGRMAWQRETNYGRRNLVETGIGRYKAAIGTKLHARTPVNQQAEAAIAIEALNRMIRTAKPVSIRVR